MEAIRLVDGSDLSVRRTLEQLGIHRSTFARWYAAYLEHGYDGLRAKKPKRRHWNRILQRIRERVLEVALTDTELSGLPPV